MRMKELRKLLSVARAGLLLFVAVLFAALPGWSEENEESARTGDAVDCIPVEDSELIEFNFEGADIREVIQGLAAGLCIHYSVDPRVQGTVTIRTANKVRGRELFPLFHQILRTNGVGAVQVGDVYHIAPVAEAKTRVPLLVGRKNRRQARAQDEFVMELVRVDHISANELAEILQPFVSPGGDVSTNARGNMVILTDLASNVRRLRQLIAAFDTDTFQELQARVYRTEHANIEDIGEELINVLQPYGVGATDAEERGVYIIPLARLDKLVVIAFNEEIFSEVDKWLKILDVPPEKGGGRTVHVFAVENAKAIELAEILGDLYGSGGRRNRASARSRGGTSGRGSASSGGSNDSSMDSGSSGGSGSGGGRYRSRGGSASGSGGTASVLIEPREGEKSVFRETIKIVADQGTNSLVVLATQRDYEKIRKVLAELDVVPRQVLIEAVIAEVSLNDDLQFGIEYAFGPKGIQNVFGSAAEAGASGIAASEDGALSIANSSILQSGAKRAVNIGSGGLFSFITDQDKFVALINAVKAKSNVKILATPHVIAANNREAHIQIGEEVPILTSTQQSTLATANIVSSIQYKDTGTILTILPQVNSAGLVNMEIEQEVSNVGLTSFGDTSSPSFTSRKTNTTVIVRDRESVLIGGIIDERVERQRNGVPYLMDVPVLGRIFRVEKDRRERTELIVLITPYVIRNRGEAEAVTQEFTSRIGKIEEMINRSRRGATPPSSGVVNVPK